MCGIVGVLDFGTAGFEVTEDLITRMRDSIAHRGPDGAGLWISEDRRVGLGHRRLAIIDLSEAAHQPMCNHDGTLWLVFNGEIYNHAELRRELKSLGHYRWKTDHSDTEVLLQAFEQWGIDCLNRLRGMFAFALWDSRNQELWLVRDRIGIKPLYYSIHHNRLTFASEIKALLQDSEQPRHVNEEGLFHYLSFLTVPAPDTLFAGIHKLPAGNWLRIRRDGTRHQARYWEVWDHVVRQTPLSDEAIAEQILATLRESVRLRKVSDVPVGVFLSGGIDSSTNAALFAEGETSPIETFSIAYQGQVESSPSELPYARSMAQRVGARHHERLLSLDDLLGFLPRMVDLQDEPLADPVCFPVYFVAELAKRHGITVCQVGEGSDELFWGYPSWKQALHLQQWDHLPVPRTFKRWGLSALERAGKQDGFPYEWLRRGSLGQPVFWGGAEAFSHRQKMSLLSPRLRRQFHNTTSWEALQPIHQRFVDGAWENTPLQWMTFLDLNLRLPELLLMRVDKMTMGVSLEGRVPFLDHKLVELAMSIPQAAKIRNGNLKHLLKTAVRGLIPDTVIDRPKQGFGVPLREWFSQGLVHETRQPLCSFLDQTDLLDRERVLALLDSGGETVWPLLNLALWSRRFLT